jgi:hypothetical protein
MTDRGTWSWLTARPWHTNAALSALGVGLLFLTRQLVQNFDPVAIGFTTIAAWSVFLYGTAAVLVLTQPVNRFTFGIILAVAIACRLVTLMPEPYLSSDIYRYAWDGVVQHAHISPYRYVPGDPALSFLRQPNQDLFDNINRRDYAHTIYPPAAQFLFFLITFLNPTVTFMKLSMILFEGLTLYAVVKLLGALGVSREQALLYAWCPLLIWEIGSSGHLDSAAIAFMMLALLARYRRQAVATGALLGIAILIKLYPLVLFPALFRRREYKMPLSVASVIALGYACYSSVGLRVFGFLDGYVKEESIQSGKRYFLLELVHRVPGLHALPPAIYFLFCTLVFAVLVAWCWNTCCSPNEFADVPSDRFGLPAAGYFLAPAFALAFAATLLFSPHYAWYIAWLVPLITLMPNLTGLVYICGLFYGSSTTLIDGIGPTDFMIDARLYSGVLAAMLLEIGVRHRLAWLRGWFGSAFRAG